MEQSIQLPLDTKAIMAILPHRYPFLMVDRITALDPGKTITGIKNITMNEMCFLGHFPGEPVMPGVLILEGMAQTGGILACLSDAALIDKARFRRIVYPGDQMVYKLEMLKQKGRVIKMAGKTYVDDQLVTEAELMASYP